MCQKNIRNHKDLKERSCKRKHHIEDHQKLTSGILQHRSPAKSNDRCHQNIDIRPDKDQIIQKSVKIPTVLKTAEDPQERI